MACFCQVAVKKLYFGPIHWTGLQRCEKTGSVKKVTPSICTKQLACPNQMACTAFPAYGVASTFESFLCCLLAIYREFPGRHLEG